MTKPKDDYVLDTNKIKTFEDVANVFKCINVICDLNVLEKVDAVGCFSYGKKIIFEVYDYEP